MKRNIKSLFVLLTLGLFLSCARAPQQLVPEKPAAPIVDLTSEKIRDSIVLIESENGSGTGFFVAPDKIATNTHVVAHAGPVSVKSPDKEKDWSIEGVVAFDAKNSLVILKIAGEGTPLPFGESEAIQMGASVSIPGYRAGEFRVVEGKIQSIRKRNKWLRIQATKETDGSPVLDNNGQVIAVIVPYNIRSYSYAVPSSVLEVLLNRSVPVEPLAEWQKRKQIRAAAYYSLGEEKLGDEDYAGAVIDFDKAIELNPAYLRAYYERGRSQAYLDDYDGAIVSCTQIIEIDPDAPDAYFLRGSVKARLRGDYAAAILDLDKAIELDAQHAYAYSNRGGVKFRLGESEETNGNAEKAQSLYQAAIADCDKAIEIDPEDADAYNPRGAAKLALDDFEGAILDFSRAIEIDPEDADAYNNLGLAKLSLGESETASGKVKEAQRLYKAAIKDITQSIQIDPEDADPYNNRGVAKFRLGEFKSARAKVKKVKKVKKAQRLYEAAIADYTQAIKINPKYADAYENQATVKCKLGDIESARGDIEKGQRLYHEGVTDYDKSIQLDNPEDVNESAADLASEKVKDSTVRVMSWAGGFYSGSGFFVKEDKVATNVHVVAQSGPVFVKLRGKEEIWAVEEVAAFNAENDLVVLKIAGESIPLSVGDNEAIQSGEPVVVVGYPDKRYKVMKGTIRSASNGDEWLRMSPNIGSGGSGSPVLNSSSGQVVGIHAAGNEHYGYVIPSSMLKALLVQSDATEPLAKWQNRELIRAYALFVQGQMKYNANHYDEAIANFDKAININAQFFYAYYKRGDAKSALGNYEAAIADYDKAREINDGIFNIYYNLGLAKYKFGDNEAAIADYDKAIEIDPEYATAYNSRGAAKFALGDLKGAILDYNKAIQIDPEDATAYSNRGWTKFKLGDLEDAILDFNRTVAIDPEHATAYHSRGLAKLRLRDFEGALLDFNRDLKINSEHADAYKKRAHTKFKLAETKKAQGDITGTLQLYQSAMDDCTQAIRLTPKDADVYDNRGWARFHLGESETARGNMKKAADLYKKAIEDYTQAIKLNLEHPHAYRNRAKAKSRLGNYGAAIIDLDKAIQINPKNAKYYYDRGRAKAALGQTEAAEADFQKAEALESDVGK